MTKYLVTASKVERASLTIEADSLEDAEELLAEYDEHDFTWHSADVWFEVDEA